MSLYLSPDRGRIILSRDSWDVPATIFHYVLGLYCYDAVGADPHSLTLIIIKFPLGVRAPISFAESPDGIDEQIPNCSPAVLMHPHRKIGLLLGSPLATEVTLNPIPRNVSWLNACRTVNPVNIISIGPNYLGPIKTGLRTVGCEQNKIDFSG